MATQRGKNLINGYIREIESMLLSNIIIPITLNKLCLKFYYSRHIIYLYSAGIHAYDFDSKFKWKSIIYDINDYKLNKNIGRDVTLNGNCSAFMAKNIHSAERKCSK